MIISFKFIQDKLIIIEENKNEDLSSTESSIVEKNNTSMSNTPTKMDSGIFKINSEKQDEISETKQNL